MQVGITVSTRELENKLHLLAKEARVAPGRVIKEESKFIAQNIIQITPPKTKKQGADAIGADLFGGRNVRRSNGGSESSVGILQRIGASREVPPRNGKTQTMGVRLGWEGSKKIRIMTKNWRPDASIAEIEAFHKKNRDARGRTSLVSRSMIGRWKVQDQLWVRDAIADKYFRILRERVGWAKAAWASLLTAAGGRPAAWYNKLQRQSGYAVVNWGENPSVMAVANDIKIPNYQRFVSNAVKNRERTTQKKIDALVAGRAVNLGFVTIPAR